MFGDKPKPDDEELVDGDVELFSLLALVLGDWEQEGDGDDDAEEDEDDDSMSLKFNVEAVDEASSLTLVSSSLDEVVEHKLELELGFSVNTDVLLSESDIEGLPDSSGAIITFPEFLFKSSTEIAEVDGLLSLSKFIKPHFESLFTLFVFSLWAVPVEQDGISAVFSSSGHCKYISFKVSMALKHCKSESFKGVSRRSKI